MTLPLAMKVSTCVKPRSIKSWRRSFHFYGMPANINGAQESDQLWHGVSLPLRSYSGGENEWSLLAIARRDHSSCFDKKFPGLSGQRVGDLHDDLATQVAALTLGMRLADVAE